VGNGGLRGHASRPRAVDDHAPRKRFGQNFLADPHYVARIVAAVDPKPGEHVVEIGPGLAALTGGLIGRAGHIDAIEIDRDLAARLRERFGERELTLHEGDALAFDFGALGSDLRVVGNLPYNISSPLLFHLAGHAANLHDLTVMLQKEVVDRMTAAPGTAEYGRLTVMLQAVFSMERLFTVPPGAFRPAPKVDSSVVRLVPRATATLGARDIGVLSRVVQAAFGQRRKMLRNTLRGWFDAERLEELGIDPKARAEDLRVADFVRLANAAGTGAPSA